MSRAEKEHYNKVAALGCLVCRRLYGPHDPGPVELHHLRAGGWGRGHFTTVMGLCVEHHRGKTGVHGLGTKAFDRRYGFTQRDLLEDALRLLGYDDEGISRVLDELSSRPRARRGQEARP